MNPMGRIALGFNRENDKGVAGWPGGYGIGNSGSASSMTGVGR